MKDQKVSVIIPVYNEEKYIRECINSIDNQNFSNLEIIVIDDGSTDGTKEILKELSANITKLKVFSQNHIGTAKARNFAAKKATGEILVFIDADMVVDKDYVKNLIDPILSGSSKGTFTKDEFVANWQNKWAVAWNLEYSQHKSRRISLNHPESSVVFRALLKTEFDRVGGYELIAYMQDWTISKKLGYKATLSKNAKVYHYNPNSLTEVFKQASWVASRKYKLGNIGKLVALLRSTLPFSLIFGVVGAIKYNYPFYFLFKIIYDFGIVFGIVKHSITGKNAQ